MNRLQSQAAWLEGQVKPAPGFSRLEISPALGSLIGLVERRVKRTPDHTAIKAGTRAISYRSLNEQANRVAHSLLSLGRLEPGLVPILMAHTPEKVMATIGVLKAGLGYVALNIFFTVSASSTTLPSITS